MGQQPYYYDPRPPAYYPPPAPHSSGTALAALIFSVLGFVGILPFLGSLVGLILGYSSRGEIDRSMGQITGRGMATTAVILGWLGMFLMLIGACIAVLVFTGVIAAPFGLAICSEFGNFQ